jgi:hypothetical protein
MNLKMKTIAIMITLFSAPAMAETIAQAQEHKTFQDQVDGQVSFANSACGTTITAPVEWSGFDQIDLSKAGANNGSVSVGQYCGEPLEALTYLCHATPAAKTAIKQHIQKVVCKYGGPGKRDVSLSNGTLNYSVDFKVGATSKMFVQAYVANHI